MGFKFFAERKLHLEINDRYMRVLAAKLLSKTIEADKFGTIVFDQPSDSLNFAQKANLLDDLLMDKEIKAGKVNICLSYSGIIARSIQVPKMRLQDLEAHMELEMNEYIPVSPEDYQFDFRVIEEFVEEERDYYNIMVAAVPSRCINEAVNIVEALELNIQTIDIFPNVMWRLMSDSEKDIGVVDAGTDGMRLMLCKGKNLVLYADNPEPYEDYSNEDFARLTEEIRGYLNFFSARHFGKSVDLLYLTGDLSLQPESPEILERNLNIRVEKSFQKKRLWGHKIMPLDFTSYASVFAGNIGLILKEV